MHKSMVSLSEGIVNRALKELLDFWLPPQCTWGNMAKTFITFPQAFQADTPTFLCSGSRSHLPNPQSFIQFIIRVLRLH